MTENKVRCDACGRPALTINYNFRTENKCGYSDHVCDTVDLCHGNMQEALQRRLKEPPAAPAESGKDIFGRWAKALHWEPAK